MTLGTCGTYACAPVDIVPRYINALPDPSLAPLLRPALISRVHVCAQCKASMYTSTCAHICARVHINVRAHVRTHAV